MALPTNFVLGRSVDCCCCWLVVACIESIYPYQEMILLEQQQLRQQQTERLCYHHRQQEPKRKPNKKVRFAIAPQRQLSFSSLGSSSPSFSYSEDEHYVDIVDDQVLTTVYEYPSAASSLLLCGDEQHDEQDESSSQASQSSSSSPLYWSRDETRKMRDRGKRDAMLLLEQYPRLEECILVMHGFKSLPATSTTTAVDEHKQQPKPFEMDERAAISYFTRSFGDGVEGLVEELNHEQCCPRGIEHFVTSVLCRHRAWAIRKILQEQQQQQRFSDADAAAAAGAIAATSVKASRVPKRYARNLSACDELLSSATMPPPTSLSWNFDGENKFNKMATRGELHPRQQELPHECSNINATEQLSGSGSSVAASACNGRRHQQKRTTAMAA